MRKFLSVLFFFSILAAFPVAAETTTSPQDDSWLNIDEHSDKNLANENIEVLPPSQIMRPEALAQTTDSFTFISDGAAIAKPECSNVRLLEKVLEKIADYYKGNPVNSAIEKRKQILMLKNLKDFKELNITTFPKKENYTVSDKLIAYKINKGLENDDMRLCRSEADLPIYLLIYPQNNAYTVEIINFPGQPISERFTVVYD